MWPWGLASCPHCCAYITAETYLLTAVFVLGCSCVLARRQLSAASIVGMLPCALASALARTTPSLRRAAFSAKPLQAAGGKADRLHTDYTGLYVEAGALGALAEIYRGTRRLLGEMPADYFYRQQMEAVIGERLEHLDRTAALPGRGCDDDGLLFGEGIPEQVVEQATEELTLVAKMIEWRAWEGLPPPAGQ